MLISPLAGAAQQRVGHSRGHPEDARHNQGETQLWVTEAPLMQLSGSHSFTAKNIL